MVPDGWIINNVGDLFTVQLGKMLNKEAKAKFPQFKYLGNSDVKWGSFDLSQAKSMHFNEKERQKFTLQKGDILMCEGGEVGRCSIWEGNANNIYYQKALHRLRSNGAVIPEYFYNFMSFIAGTKALDDYTTRTSIAHLTREKLLKIPVKTPPLPEQRKIAKILSTWDKAISTTERLIDNSKQQKKALMQQLLTGKKRLLDDSGRPFEGEWEEVEVGKLTKIYDGTHSTPKYVDKGVPFYSVEHLTKDCFLNTKFISEEVFHKENKRVKLEKNDILMTRIGDIGTAKCLTWDVRASFYVSLALFKSSKAFNSQYLTYYINSHEFHRELWKRTIHVAFPKKINLGEISHCVVKLPTLLEQQKIASVLAAADKEIDLLEKQLSNLKQEKKALMQQLLTGKRRVKLDDTAAA